VDRNRAKFFLAGALLEAANSRIPGRPHQQLADAVPDEPGEVLDLCCGTGYVARLVARTHPHAVIHALDASPEMLRVGRRKAAKAGLDGISFVHGDAAQLPFADDSLDVVLAAFGLHELPRAIRERAIAEVRRALRPDGRLLCMDLDQRAPPSAAVDLYLRLFEAAHARDVLGMGLVEQLTNAGFTVAEHRRQRGRLPPFQLIDARPLEGGFGLMRPASVPG
jgi:demethylmenaquinone methyltransferase/2-methoxy-6-polyprenyl-1,4-benzoquinol methylase